MIGLRGGFKTEGQARSYADKVEHAIIEVYRATDPTIVYRGPLLEFPKTDLVRGLKFIDRGRLVALADSQVEVQLGQGKNALIARRERSSDHNPYMGDAVEIAKQRKYEEERTRWERGGRRGPPPAQPRKQRKSSMENPKAGGKRAKNAETTIASGYERYRGHKYVLAEYDDGWHAFFEGVCVQEHAPFKTREKAFEAVKRQIERYPEREANPMTLSKTDKAVIRAFTEQRAASSKKLETDGQRLDIIGMGGQRAAEWKGDKIHFNDLGSRSGQTVQAAVRKAAPKNDLYNGRGWNPVPTESARVSAFLESIEEEDFFDLLKRAPLEREAILRSRYDLDEDLADEVSQQFQEIRRTKAADASSTNPARRTNASWEEPEYQYVFTSREDANAFAEWVKANIYQGKARVKTALPEYRNTTSPGTSVFFRTFRLPDSHEAAAKAKSMGGRKWSAIRNPRAVARGVSRGKIRSAAESTYGVPVALLRKIAQSTNFDDYNPLWKHEQIARLEEEGMIRVSKPSRPMGMGDVSTRTATVTPKGKQYLERERNPQQANPAVYFSEITMREGVMVDDEEDVDALAMNPASRHRYRIESDVATYAERDKIYTDPDHAVRDADRIRRRGPGAYADVQVDRGDPAGVWEAYDERNPLKRIRNPDLTDHEDELVLYIDNTASLYEVYKTKVKRLIEIKQGKVIYKGGTQPIPYDTSRGITFFRPLVEDAAQMYRDEIDRSEKWKKAELKRIAQDYAERFERDYDSGELAWLGGPARPNPSDFDYLTIQPSRDGFGVFAVKYGRSHQELLATKSTKKAAEAYKNKLQRERNPASRQKNPRETTLRRRISGV